MGSGGPGSGEKGAVEVHPNETLSEVRVRYFTDFFDVVVSPATLRA